MEKSLFEQMGGTYTQVGDYLLPNLILPEQQDQPLGVWGQRHARYLKQHHKIIYMNLLTSGKLNDYLVDIENQAENLFLQLVKQLAESENITEELKANAVSVERLCLHRANSQAVKRKTIGFTKTAV